ncbi:MAG: hypothetical protein ACREHD_31320, partial [Pirellulales bacterium]
VLGWGNMWGNLGAAMAPVLATIISGEGKNIDWNSALTLCAAAFVVSGIASFFIDATKPVIKATTEDAAPDPPRRNQRLPLTLTEHQLCRVDRGDPCR